MIAASLGDDAVDFTCVIHEGVLQDRESATRIRQALRCALHTRSVIPLLSNQTSRLRILLQCKEGGVFVPLVSFTPLLDVEPFLDNVLAAGNVALASLGALASESTGATGASSSFFLSLPTLALGDVDVGKLPPGSVHVAGDDFSNGRLGLVVTTFFLRTAPCASEVVVSAS